jgi:DNA helicase II / ATP-dependent DNA helicase PcrA
MKEFVLGNQMSPKNCKIDYEKELNKEQLDVVINGDGPCLVLAGAGSGKTRTITYRVAYLIENGVAPENILLVTFTNKAAKEMIQRVEQLLGSYPTGLWSGTFHSIANRVMRKYAPQVSYTNNFTILDQEDAKSLIKVAVKELQVDTTGRRFPSPRNLISMISYSRNAGKTIKDVVENRYQNFFDLIPMIERVAEVYESKKRQADAMDFDDLIILLRNLLHESPEARERLANQFQYVLVDEYQDTNVVQSAIVQSLASVHENLLVVGDDAQSIYSFRAAEIQNILNFPKVYPNAITFQLTSNYRSSPEILDVANKSIEQNTNQFKKALDAMVDSREKPSLVPASNAQEEAQYIAEQILVLRDEGIKLEEMAVLFRAAFHSQALEFELMRRDIPYEYRGGMKFFERAHVKDVVSFLKLAANVKDQAAWLRVLGLQQGIGLVTAMKIIDKLQGCESLEDVVNADLKLGKRAGYGWGQALEIFQKMVKVDKRPAELIRAVVNSSYKTYLETEYPDFMDRLDDLEQFATFADTYEDLFVFLDEVSLTENYGGVREQASQDDERMVLSTIHQAKGLEWDAVFIMHLTDNKFPNPRALEEDGGLEEERRLFYVATTRARKHLFYTYPVVSGYDALGINQPSTFLEEIPRVLLEQVKLRRTPAMQSRQGGWNNSDPVIVFNELGEEEKPDKPMPSSFLRNLDEL